MKIFVALLTKKSRNRFSFHNEYIYGSVDKNQQEIGSNLLIKKFVALLIKNQEIGSNLLMNIYRV